MSHVPEITQIIKELLDRENAMLQQACSEYLGRPVTPKDAKKFRRETVGNTDTYRLMKGRVHVGTFQRTWNGHFCEVVYTRAAQSVTSETPVITGKVKKMQLVK